MEAGRGLGHTGSNGKLGGAWAVLQVMEAGRGLGHTASNGKLGRTWPILEAGQNITYNKGYFL